jgi:hypothetical protein
VASQCTEHPPPHLQHSLLFLTQIVHLVSLQVSTVACISPETRDCAVQILDAFIAQLDGAAIRDPLKDNSAFFIGLAAASAIILASKVRFDVVCLPVIVQLSTHALRSVVVRSMRSGHCA